MEIRVTRLDPDLPLPQQQHTDDAGYDLHARERVVLASGGGRGLVPTGLAIAIPSGHAGFVLPRSGLALQHGVTCLNTPGLIDPLYRGELKVLLVNTDPDEPYTVERGERIAQLVVQRVESVDWVEVDELDVTARDTFGFGSTGGFGSAAPGS
jgi:dUTP pyrophosphatase